MLGDGKIRTSDAVSVGVGEGDGLWENVVDAPWRPDRVATKPDAASKTTAMAAATRLAMTFGSTRGSFRELIQHLVCEVTGYDCPAEGASDGTDSSDRAPNGVLDP